MTYLRWTIGKDITANFTARFSLRGWVELYTEIDDSGCVSREVAVDGAGSVVHRAPSPDDPYGLFDNQVVDVVERDNDIAPEAFEQLWRLDPE